jgi:hypothetical protein
MELAKADRFFVHRTLREWAKMIGCSLGLVARLFFRQARDPARYISLAPPLSTAHNR